MKTIEQAVRSFLNHYDYLGNRQEEPIAEHAFKKGVEFAQQWISVDDELPEDTVIFDSIEEAFIAMAKEPITVVECPRFKEIERMKKNGEL